MDPTGSGSGITLKDWDNSRQGVMDPGDFPNQTQVKQTKTSSTNEIITIQKRLDLHRSIPCLDYHSNPTVRKEP